MPQWAHADAPHAGGQLDDVFRHVGDVFASSMLSNGDYGGAFAAVRDGDVIVDIRAGHTDRARTVPWHDDTIVCIYSVGKAVMALLTAAAVSADALDYERAVAADWPEFGAAGKELITLGQAISHQGGLSGFPEEMDPGDWLQWDLICERLASSAPLWAPGTASGYHPQTIGFIIGELIKRKTGKSIGAWLSDNFKNDGLDIHCGLSPEVFQRASFMAKPRHAGDLGTLTELKRIAFLKRWSGPARVAPEKWAAAEIPASNMHANAISLAKFLQPFVNGGKWLDGRALIDQATLEASLRERVRGDDLVLPFNISWSAGLMRNTNGHYGPNPNAYGHAGAGGACVVVDPENRLTAAYVTNTMSPYLVGDPRATAVLGALYENL